MGAWYEQLRSKSIRFEKWDCVQAKYTLEPDGSVAVRNTQYNEEKRQVDRIDGKAHFDGAVGSVKFFWFLPGGNYQVVATDYTSFAVVYSFTNILWLCKSEAAWILTRERNPSEELIDHAFGLLQQRTPHLRREDFRRTIHGDDSKYLPN